MILLENKGKQGKFCWELGNMDPLPPGRPQNIYQKTPDAVNTLSKFMLKAVCYESEH